VRMAKILLITDIHANHESLKTILENAGNYDEIFVLGDLVDYGPDPDLVLDEVRGAGAKIIKGNHDEAVGKNVDCRCGHELHDVSEYTRNAISMKKLSDNDRRFLSNLPEILKIESVNPPIILVHGTLQQPLYGYLYPWLRNEEICFLLQEKKSYRLSVGKGRCELGELTYFVGHTHHQFLRKVGKATVINPGSAGQPRDGDTRASYAVYDTVSNSVTFYRIRYDVEKVLSKLRELVGDRVIYEKLAKVMREATV